MKIGDRVMCVDVDWAPNWGGTEAPVLGGVYTVRGVRGTGGILLGGIVNSLFRDGEEYGFRQFHFRKLDDIPDRAPALTARQQRRKEEV